MSDNFYENSECLEIIDFHCQHNPDHEMCEICKSENDEACKTSLKYIIESYCEMIGKKKILFLCHINF